jgi:hypothetical protein
VGVLRLDSVTLRPDSRIHKKLFSLHFISQPHGFGYLFMREPSLEVINPEGGVGLADLSEDGFRVGRGNLRIGRILVLRGAGNRHGDQNERDGYGIFHSHLEHIQTSLKVSFLPMGEMDQCYRKIGINNENVEGK